MWECRPLWSKNVTASPWGRRGTPCYDLKTLKQRYHVRRVLSLALLQQDLLGLVQAQLEGVEFAGVLVRGCQILPQKSVAVLAAQSRAQAAHASRIPRVRGVGFGPQQSLQQLQLLRHDQEKNNLRGNRGGFRYSGKKHKAGENLLVYHLHSFFKLYNYLIVKLFTLLLKR